MVNPVSFFLVYNFLFSGKCSLNSAKNEYISTGYDDFAHTSEHIRKKNAISRNTFYV